MTSPECRTHELDPNSVLEAIIDDPLKPLALGILAETIEPMTAPAIVSNINQALEESTDAETEFGIGFLDVEDTQSVLAACEEMETGGLVTIDRTSAEPLIQITELGIQVGLPIAGVAAGWQLDYGHALYKALFRSKHQLRFSIIELIVLGTAGTVIQIAEMLAMQAHQVEQEVKALRRDGVIQYPPLLRKPPDPNTSVPTGDSTDVTASRPDTAAATRTVTTAATPGQSVMAKVATWNTVHPQSNSSPTLTTPQHRSVAAPAASTTAPQPASAAPQHDNHRHESWNEKDILTITPEHTHSIRVLVHDMREVLDGRAEPSERARRQAIAIAHEPGLIKRLCDFHKRFCKSKRTSERSERPSASSSNTNQPSGDGGGSSIEKVIEELLLAVNMIASDFQDSFNGRLIAASYLLEDSIQHAAEAIQTAQTIEYDSEDYAEAQQAIDTWQKKLGGLMLKRTELEGYIRQTNNNEGIPLMIHSIINQLRE